MLNSLNFAVTFAGHEGQEIVNPINCDLGTVACRCVLRLFSEPLLSLWEPLVFQMVQLVQEVSILTFTDEILNHTQQSVFTVYLHVV